MNDMHHDFIRQSLDNKETHYEILELVNATDEKQLLPFELNKLIQEKLNNVSDDLRTLLQEKIIEIEMIKERDQSLNLARLDERVHAYKTGLYIIENVFNIMDDYTFFTAFHLYETLTKKYE